MAKQDEVQAELPQDAEVVEDEELEVVEDYTLVYPLSSNVFPFQERHRTIGQLESVLSVAVIKADKFYSGTYIPNGEYEENTIIQRYTPDGKKSACRLKGNMPSLWARLLTLAAESVKGRDSGTARVSAYVLANTWKHYAKEQPIDAVFIKLDKELDELYVGDDILRLEFPVGQQTAGNMGKTNSWFVFVKTREMFGQAFKMATSLTFMDKLTPRTAKAPDAAVAQSVKKVTAKAW